MEDLKKQYLYEMKSLINENQIKDYRDEKIDIKINKLKENFNGMSIEINKKKKLQQLEYFDSIISPKLSNSLSILYDNSISSNPLKEFNSENSDAVIESFSPSPIPVEDSDSLMEEIDIFLAPDDSIPPVYYVPSSPRPLEKPPDDDDVFTLILSPIREFLQKCSG
ncbi:hypothetical protein Tco_0247085 [Tanacetum coccineum]